MIIYLDAKAGQTVEEFATELCWIANRINAVMLGMFCGTEIYAYTDSLPSELVALYYRLRKEPSPYDGVIGVPGAKLEGGFR